jgi:hypothetical protein
MRESGLRQQETMYNVRTLHNSTREILNPEQSKPERLVRLKPRRRGRKIVAHPANFTHLLFVGPIKSLESAIAIVHPTIVFSIVGVRV